MMLRMQRPFILSGFGYVNCSLQSFTAVCCHLFLLKKPKEFIFGFSCDVGTQICWICNCIVPEYGGEDLNRVMYSQNSQNIYLIFKE